MKKYRIVEADWNYGDHPFYYYLIQRRRKFRFWKWANTCEVYRLYVDAEKRLKELENEK